MPIKCTYGDFVRLFDDPKKPGEGPLSKLRLSAEPSIVDKARIKRLFSALSPEISSYQEALVELGKKYGQPNYQCEECQHTFSSSEVQKVASCPKCGATSHPTSSYLVQPEHMQEFQAERKKLEETEVEVAAVPLPTSSYEKVSSLTAADLDALEKFVVLPED